MALEDRMDVKNTDAPAQDGEVNIYMDREAADVLKHGYNEDDRVIFINGMQNTGKNHKDSCLHLSFMVMKPVLGIYNKEDGLIGDLWQCLIDKLTFNGPFSTSARSEVSQQEIRNIKELIQQARNRRNMTFADAFAEVKALYTQLQPAELMEIVLSGNEASVVAFKELRKKENQNADIYAHSQGNLILSNVLQAIEAVDGAGAISGRKVHSFGSPSVNWPSGLDHQEYAFTGDPVALLAGFDFGFKISKVGLHDVGNFSDLSTPGKIGEMIVPNFISHGFEFYVKNDPVFVVNTFRWGGWGMTASMDEKGLAHSLLSMGRNTTRVQKVMEHLDRSHNSDSDDVALIYVQEMMSNAVKHAVAIQGLKGSRPLRELLYKVMDEGWTSADEKKAMKWLDDLVSYDKSLA